VTGAARGSRESDLGAPRGLLLAVTTALAFEASLYSVVAPLLPYYRDELHLGTSGAGLLTAMYPAGMLAGSVLGGAVSAKRGPRTTAFAGFGLLAVASVAFGLAGSVVVLDVSRAAQGLGAGMIWAGMLSWLLLVTPEHKRGQAIGAALGSAIFGTVLGPMLGTAANALTPPVAFSAIALGALAMAWRTSRLPAPPAGSAVEQGGVGRALRSRRLAAVFTLNLLPGLVTATVATLIPLRLDDRGVSELTIGVVFLLAAVLGGIASPLSGRASDRRGRRPVALAGLGLVAATMFALAGASAPVVLGVVTVLAIGAAVVVFSIPALAALSSAAEDVGMTAGATAALINISFAGAEAVGAPISAVAADHVAAGLPFAAIGVAAVLLAAVLAAFPHTRPLAPVVQTERIP